MIFSPSTMGFYDPAKQAQYEAAGSWPADGVAISDADWRTYSGDQPAGKTLGVVNGFPAWVDVPAAPKPTTLTASAFQARFTASEQQAVFAACIANVALGAVLIHGISSNAIDLTSADASAWINGLVAAGALTSARAAEILTP